MTTLTPQIITLTRNVFTSLVCLLFALPVMAGEITYPDNSYSSGETLTAVDLNTKFGEIKADVNDNNGRISALESSTPPPSDLNQLLNGTYDLIALDSCVEATSISASLVPSGYIVDVNSQLNGTATFDGAGNLVANFTSTYIAIPFDHTSAPVQIGATTNTCNETYTVNADGTVTIAGTCNTTFTQGPMAGGTGILTGYAVQGFVNAQGTTVIKNFADGNVHQVSNSTGYAADRVCTHNATLMRQ